MPTSTALVRTFVLIVGLFLSIYLGMLVVTDRFEILMWVGLAAVLILCIWLGRDLWLIIPATMYVRFIFPWLPGGFPPQQIAILLVIGWFILLFAMRRLSLSLRFTHVEFTALLLIILIFQGYARNPVGVSVLGTGSVGGKSYFAVIVAVMGGCLLASLRVTPDRVRKAMRVMLAGTCFSTAISLLAYASPTIASVTGPILGAFGQGNPFAETPGIDRGPVDEGRTDRVACAIELAGLLSRWVTAKVNPFRALMHPVWGTLVMIALAASAMSGFRNAVIATGFTFAAGIFYWGRGTSLLAAAGIGIVMYLVVILLNPVMPLPPNMQRSLTFLPGTWEQRYKDDARRSTEWRVEMWRLAIMTDRYIQNKYFGDGLGMTSRELQFLRGLGEMRSLSNEMTQERAMMTQAYHSGPVQTVRIIGYIGLIVLLYAMIVLAVRAHRLIIAARGTESFSLVLFLCLHMVWHPIFFTLVFGAFGEDVPALLMNMGILRLIENNLPLPLPPFRAASLALPIRPSARNRAYADRAQA